MTIRDDLIHIIARNMYGDPVPDPAPDASAEMWDPADTDEVLTTADAVLAYLGRHAPKLLAVVADEDDEDEPPCPRCGGEPDDPTLHTEDCPTLGTCGQTDPEMDPPWHLDEEWWDGEESYSVAYRRHVETSHRRKP